jgi:hypothetical protein
LEKRIFAAVIKLRILRCDHPEFRMDLTPMTGALITERQEGHGGTKL